MRMTTTKPTANCEYKKRLPPQKLLLMQPSPTTHTQTRVKRINSYNVRTKQNIKREKKQ